MSFLFSVALRMRSVAKSGVPPTDQIRSRISYCRLVPQPLYGPNAATAVAPLVMRRCHFLAFDSIRYKSELRDDFVAVTNLTHNINYYYYYYYYCYYYMLY